MQIIDGTIASPKGFYATGLHAGLKKEKKDLGVIYSAIPANAAAVYTTNQVKAAPIFVTKEAMADQKVQSVVVNSGIANACTGDLGLENAKEMQSLAASQLNVAKENVAVASTGVIGKQLPMEIIESGISKIDLQQQQPYAFHEAILTTDTSTKEIVVTEEINGQMVTMAGVAKGSGMIHPNMATMLAFITTDAQISKDLLQEMLADKTETTFNQITVDGDTSTNDMVLVLANGLAENPIIEKNSEAHEKFIAMFQLVSETLAKMIAKDGEGATKLIEVQVVGALSDTEARLVAKKVVGSSLVKTAMFGEDPNWGRIICAVGYAGSQTDPEKIDMWIGDQQLLKHSQPQEFDELVMKETLEKEKICITVDLNIGEQSGKAWGCDLTYKYIEVNALYHT
ncbi:bifunctional ornithine acetyltransferase/N-acetylglutamate synthase [Enterococcus malodoratus]|uniref:Arginine biosynthesis bifunctional protein ArgJ n=1 Tax=Enterococcus malodoratus ATCC 43197 TaxID=1158601 RepID=R2RM85_9ENTE|nr:bifunctional ornithine acetyltransferase/N-acetylglutamate synthase [Enterococcus malodoratus]EOH81691.1 glutamate N-acetyltransferase/amino-acid acetyltransferase [Enterococcus malodoratus ATCC 43197]EOT68773.1 glutamate N-acetyltransferase/amino-acid acetyltransferase [Enterococcus malodoratus ATCC 43197]OJG64843.1 glutamate N-acetyltransferase/amino-acid acetyltransferase [Enterococcus malodoratus]SPW86534.1 glutamate N-acetyltransferase/amino-acid acetyltransferase [Enterococcus malodora